MNPKLKYSLLAIAAILILCGCESNKTPKKSDCYFEIVYNVDTLNINGNPHEFIFVKDKGSYGINTMHSPECWCGKGGER